MSGTWMNKIAGNACPETQWAHIPFPGQNHPIKAHRDNSLKIHPSYNVNDRFQNLRLSSVVPLLRLK